MSRPLVAAYRSASSWRVGKPGSDVVATGRPGRTSVESG